MAERTPRRQSGKSNVRTSEPSSKKPELRRKEDQGEPASKDLPQQGGKYPHQERRAIPDKQPEREDSRLFRRREDLEAEKELGKKYVRGNLRKRIPRKEKDFKGSDKTVTKGLRFDASSPLAARQARREAEGKHFVPPEPEALKMRPGMKKLRRPLKKSNAETSMSAARRRVSAERAAAAPGREPTRSGARLGERTATRRREDRAQPEEQIERRAPRAQPTLAQRRAFASRGEPVESPKPKRKREGRKYDKPSTTPGERVQKLIANAGLASRREAETWIEEGRVQVNGVTIKLGDKALPSDKVTVNGAPVTFHKHHYYMLHKPKGYVTTRDDKVYKKRTVMDLIPVEERIYPVGRLDKDTTGLLLFTSDGEWANRIMHPRYEVEKVYIATLDRPFEHKHIAELQQGVRLKEGVVKAKVRLLSTRKVEVTLHQGLNHVVKRILKEKGYWVADLARVKVGAIALDIPLGAYRPLTQAEISKF
jgi:23S rRNA pseudouridine2605 synthase